MMNLSDQISADMERVEMRQQVQAIHDIVDEEIEAQAEDNPRLAEIACKLNSLQAQLR